MTRRTKKILVVVGVVVGVFLFVGYMVRNMFSDIFGGIAVQGGKGIASGIFQDWLKTGSIRQ